VSDDAVLVIYVGRLGAEKGLAVALDGMRDVMRGHLAASGSRSPVTGLTRQSAVASPLPVQSSWAA